MTRLQLFISQFRVFRSLIIASVIWIVVLLAFYYSLDPEFIESIEKKRNGVEDSPSFNKAIDGNELDRDEASNENKKLIATESSSEKVTKVFAFKSLVTPVSVEILQELGLKNPGENGRAVFLKNVSKLINEKVRQGWKRHEFNEFVSDLISVRRKLPDPRQEYCLQDDLYLDELPSTSVIIIFHNEAWSTLLRSVHSVMDQSPDRLIEEIILVDDFSHMREISNFAPS